MSSSLLCIRLELTRPYAGLLDDAAPATTVHRVKSGRGHMLVKPFASTFPLTSDFGLWSTNPPPCVALKVVLTLKRHFGARLRLYWVAVDICFLCPNFIGTHDVNVTFSRENTRKLNIKIRSNQTSNLNNVQVHPYIDSFFVLLPRDGSSMCKYTVDKMRSNEKSNIVCLGSEQRTAAKTCEWALCQLGMWYKSNGCVKHRTLARQFTSEKTNWKTRGRKESNVPNNKEL